MTVYLGSRDLNGVLIGTHQFIVLANSYLLSCRNRPESAAQARHLGKRNRQELFGVVVGAQNIHHKLIVEYFEGADTAATHEFFGLKEKKWYLSDFDTEMFPVNFGEVKEQAAIERILFLIENYNINVTQDSIRYPTAGLGFNSNSWAQSIIQYAGGKTIENTAGLDVSSDRRIPKIYFEPISTKRPKVN